MEMSQTKKGERVRGGVGWNHHIVHSHTFVIHLITQERRDIRQGNEGNELSHLAKERRSFIGRFT